MQARKAVVHMKIMRSAEDYLEAMLMLKERHGYIRSIDIATELNVTKPSVSYATKRLAENGYIQKGSGSAITLTDAGMEIASRIYERHKVLTYLLLRLGVDESHAREDACKIEHDLSVETFDRIRDYAYALQAEEAKAKKEGAD